MPKLKILLLKLEISLVSNLVITDVLQYFLKSLETHNL